MSKVFWFCFQSNSWSNMPSSTQRAHRTTSKHTTVKIKCKSWNDPENAKQSAKFRTKWECGNKIQFPIPILYPVFIPFPI